MPEPERPVIMTTTGFSSHLSYRPEKYALPGLSLRRFYETEIPVVSAVDDVDLSGRMI